MLQEAAQQAAQPQQMSMLMAYWQSMGIMLAQWLPIIGLMYFAIRRAIRDGLAAYEAKVELVRLSSPTHSLYGSESVKEARAKSAMLGG